jgi:hypothetical protein
MNKKLKKILITTPPPPPPPPPPNNEFVKYKPPPHGVCQLPIGYIREKLDTWSAWMDYEGAPYFFPLQFL